MANLRLTLKNTKIMFSSKGMFLNYLRLHRLFTFCCDGKPNLKRLLK